MRILILVAAASVIATPVLADTTQRCGGTWKTMSYEQQAKFEGYSAFSRICQDISFTVPTASPSLIELPTAAPPGSTGQCRDGSFTTALRRKYACPGHGGLERWLYPNGFP